MDSDSAYHQAASESIYRDYNKKKYCLEHKVALSNFYDEFESDGNSFIQKALQVTGIMIGANDNLPKNICHRCRYKIELSYEFINLAQKSQEILKEKLTIDLPNISQNASNYKGPNVEKTNEESRSTPMNNDTNDFNDSKPDSNYTNILKANKNNQCLLCFTKCNDNESLHDHILNHIEGTDLEPYHIAKDNLFCKLCNKYFQHRFSYLEDQREHLNIKPYICHYKKCKLSFYSNATLKQHLQIHSDKKFLCSTCGTGFKRKSDAKLHEIIHKENTYSSTCNFCGVLCKNRITLSAHLRKHQNSPRFKCTQCPKQYYSKSELKRHHWSHSKEKMFVCADCNKSYYSQSALHRHYKACCFASTKFSCDLCKLKFDNAEFAKHVESCNS